MKKTTEQVSYGDTTYTVYFDNAGNHETVHESRDGYVCYSGSEPYSEDKHGWLIGVEQRDIDSDPLILMLRRYEYALRENNYLRTENSRLKHDNDKMYRGFVMHQKVEW